MKNPTNPVYYTLPLLSVFNLLFVTLYVILVWHNVYAADDYFFVYNAKFRGVIGAVLFTAKTWTPRPAEMLLYYTLVKYSPEHFALVSYGIAVFALLGVSVYKLVKLILRNTAIALTNFEIINYVLLFVCLFFFICISIGETWFWLCSSAGYLLSLIAFLWGLIFLLSKKTNVFNSVLLILCFVYVMGAAETFAVLVVALLFILLVIQIFNCQFQLQELKNNIFFRKVFIVCSISLITVLVIYYSEGATFRKSILKQASMGDTLILSIKAMAHLVIRFTTEKLLYAVLFSIPFILIGKKISESSVLNQYFTKKIFLTISILFLLITFTSFIPAAYIMSDRGPDRSLTVNAFLLSLFFVYLSVFIGYYINTKYLLNAVLGCIVFNIIFMGYTLFIESGKTKIYSEAVKKRAAYVVKENLSNRRALLTLPPLPSPGFYYPAELTSDTADYRNQFFKQYFNLKYSVKLMAND